jgi:hypothetical protein
MACYAESIRMFDVFDNERIFYITGMLTAMSHAYVVAP